MASIILISYISSLLALICLAAGVYSYKTGWRDPRYFFLAATVLFLIGGGIILMFLRLF